jgi:diketogulonate reductase-like aldo/keto reductase
MLTVTIRVLLTCYFANNLTLASEKLSMTLFHSNWTKESKKFKTAMKLFMENSKKPMKISAFGVFNINLENFLRIINSAYSLYAVLKQMNTKV